LQRFDLVVIGSGPGGYRSAVLGAQRGLAVAIIEKDAWGGACLNRGCVPKKVWYASARLLEAAAQAAARGLRGSLEPDAPAAWRAQREVVAATRAGYVDYLKRLGVRMFEGEARFVDARRLSVSGLELEAQHVVIATGSRPALPASLAGVPRVLDTDRLFCEPLPAGRRVALLGSGAVGVEMAFILTRLGMQVLWLTGQAPLAASRFSAPARKRLAERLAALGVAARTASRPLRAEAGAQSVVLGLPGGAREQVDWVLAGTGRVPNTEALGLEAAGVRVDPRGFIEVDEAQRSSVRGIYAIGDCANPAMTANHALAEASTALAEIGAPGSARAARTRVPEVLYSALELARLGATEDELEDAELEYEVGFSAFGANPAALAEGEAEGYVRLLVEPGGGALLGCEIVGGAAGELIHLVQRPGGATARLQELVGAALSHPSRGESLLAAAEALDAEPR
jgi:dihydrolipoamide dehydrogenase